jgi:hypothetical protein
MGSYCLNNNLCFSVQLRKLHTTVNKTKLNQIASEVFVPRGPIQDMRVPLQKYTIWYFGRMKLKVLFSYVRSLWH